MTTLFCEVYTNWFYHVWEYLSQDFHTDIENFYVKYLFNSSGVCGLL